MATRRHDETSAPAEGFEARLEDAFAWVTGHAREVTIGLVAFLVIGGAAAGTYEYLRHRAAAGQLALGLVEQKLIEEMAEDPALKEKPLEPEQVAQIREATLASLESVIDEYGGTAAGSMAAIRAAEMEIDLGRLQAADERLAALTEDLARDDGLRGIALRLRGYVLEGLGREAEAAQTYAMAGSVAGYGDRAGAWLAAAWTFERIGDAEQAILAYQEVVSLDPGLADGWGIAGRLDSLIAGNQAGGGAKQGP